MHLLGAGVYGAKFRAGFGRRLVCHKTDEKFAGIDVAAFGKRVSRDDAAQFGGRAVNDAGAKAELAFDCFFDALGESGEVAVAGAEDDVAAVDVGLASGEFERFIKGSKRIHFDLIAADDVDAAKQGDDGWHGAKYTTKNRGRDNAESGRYA